MIHNHWRPRAHPTSWLRHLAAALVCGALLASAATSASARWLLESGKDAAGHETRSASVSAQNRDAVLKLDCENGTQQLSIAANRSFERGTIASIITVDQRPPKSGLLKVYSGRSDIPIFDIPISELMGSKRLAIELQPITGAPTRYVFDMSGAKTAAKAVSCGPKRASLLRRLESKLPPLRARLKKVLPARARETP